MSFTCNDGEQIRPNMTHLLFVLKEEWICFNPARARQIETFC